MSPRIAAMVVLALFIPLGLFSGSRDVALLLIIVSVLGLVFCSLIGIQRPEREASEDHAAR